MKPNAQDLARAILGVVRKALNGNGSRGEEARLRAAHEAVLRTGGPELTRRLGYADGKGDPGDFPPDGNLGEKTGNWAGGLIVSDGVTAGMYLAALETVLADSEDGQPGRRP